MTQNKRPHVVVVGAGFGGLWATRALRHAPVTVTLIDRRNYHTFLPLLYQVATAELEPEEIAYPVRSILRGRPNTQFLLGEVNQIDFATQRIQTSSGQLGYDFLLLALGSTSHFFGVPGAAQFAFPLKTLEHGIALRNHILECFEKATHVPEAERRQRALTFTVVGGGATGVEFAGALAELIHGPLVKDYPTLDVGQMRLVLLEGGEQLLPTLPAGLRDYAYTRLLRLGVDVRLRATASQISAQAVQLKDGSLIPTETVVWTAGVRGASLARAWGLPIAVNGQVQVLPTLQVASHPEVYVIGDLARVAGDQPPLPLTAPVATQQGVAAAQNVARQVAGRPPQPFHYHDQGTMAVIGRNAAVASVAGRPITGFVAWMVWLAVHIYNLIGFRNRLFVLLNWAWDYVAYERAVRLILPATAPVLSPETLPPPGLGSQTVTPTLPPDQVLAELIPLS
jgi:NADH dehydrogenase